MKGVEKKKNDKGKKKICMDEKANNKDCGKVEGWKKRDETKEGTFLITVRKAQ